MLRLPVGRRFLCHSAIALLIVCGAQRASYAKSYNFRSIDNNTGPYNQPSEIALNNEEQVAVSWLQDTGSNAIVLYSPSSTRVVASGGSSGVASYFNVSYPSLNNSGQVGFNGTPYPSLAWNTIRDTSGSKSTIATYTSSQAPGNGTDINDSGVMAFKMVPVPGNSFIVRSNGTTSTTIVTNNADGFTFLGDPTINNSGQVAFRAKRNNHFGIYIGTGSAITTVADDSGPIFDVFGLQTSFNNAGTALFSATMDDDSQALYTGNGTTLTKVADSSGPFASFSWSSINNNGDYAFIGTTDSGTTGIYTGTDPVSDKVVAIGDSMFGSTISQLILYHNGLNDNGQIAFRYRLSSGVYGVGLASVPEPSTAGLIVAVASISLFRRGSARITPHLPATAGCRAGR